MSQNVRCSYCDEFFVSQEDLEAHRRKVLDKRGKLTKSKESEYTCVYVGFVRAGRAWTRRKP